MSFSPKRLAIAVIVAMTSSVIVAQSQGVGAILKKDSTSYTNSKADKPEFVLKAGTFVAFYKGLTWGDYKSENGYIRVAFFENNDEGQEKFTWVAEDKLEFFFFPCVQGSGGFSTRKSACVPVQVKGLHHQWALEFKVAAKNKCKEIGVLPAIIAILPSDTPKDNPTPTSKEP